MSDSGKSDKTSKTLPKNPRRHRDRNLEGSEQPTSEVIKTKEVSGDGSKQPGTNSDTAEEVPVNGSGAGPSGQPPPITGQQGETHGTFGLGFGPGALLAAQAQAQAFMNQAYQQYNPWMGMMNNASFSQAVPHFQGGYNAWNYPSYGWDQGSVTSGPEEDELSAALSRQQTHDLSVSDGESEDEAELEKSGGKKVVKDSKDLPPLKSGSMATMIKEQQESAAVSEVGKAVNPHLAQTYTQYLTEKYEKKKYETLVAKYPGVDNIPKLMVLKTDEEIFLVLPEPLKTLDKELQEVQEGLMAGLSALAPVVNEMLERGAGDEPLDKLSSTVVDGIQALVMTNNHIIHKRKELHKPHMKPEFVRAIAKMKEDDMDHKWLYGGVVDVAVNNYEKVRKAARGAMKETQQNTKKPAGNQPPPNKKQKYGGNKPQQVPGNQGSFGNFHYPGQGIPPQGFNPGYNTAYNPRFNQGAQQQFRPRNSGYRPRAPNPPAAAAGNPNQQGFQKKGNK